MLQSQERECDECHIEDQCVEHETQWLCADCLFDATGIPYVVDEDGRFYEEDEDEEDIGNGREA